MVIGAIKKIKLSELIENIWKNRWKEHSVQRLQEE